MKSRWKEQNYSWYLEYLSGPRRRTSRNVQSRVWHSPGFTGHENTFEALSEQTDDSQSSVPTDVEDDCLGHKQFRRVLGTAFQEQESSLL